MKSIAIFNNKGGVGKTTLLANLASYLALKMQKKVLIIDADPQCNITQLLFSDRKIEQIYSDKKFFTIYNVVYPLSIGSGYSSIVHVERAVNFGVDILVGDPRLALTEDLLAADWSSALGGNVRGLKTSLLFRDLLSKIGDYDIVLFDVGPSLGAINRAVLLASDFFLSPMSIDIFSLRAIENIHVAIKSWRKGFETAVANIDLEAAGLDEVEFKLKFLGYVTQQYISRGSDSQGKPRAVDAYERIRRRVDPTIRTNFVDKTQAEYEGIDLEIGSIPNLYSLIPMAQSARKPVFSLRSADGVRGAHFAKVEDADKLFDKLANRFEQNLAALS